MKYKILLTGRNQTIIDDFFGQLGDNLEIMTTSMRYDDILHHIKYVRPDALVYCIKNESMDNINRMYSLKSRIMENDIPLIVIGSPAECEDFAKIAVNTADLVLTTPMKVSDIERDIVSDITKRKKIQEDTYKQFVPPDDPAAFGMPERRKHILVIDDNSTMLKALKEHLRDTYDVATAISGKVALKFLETKRTDLILLDYEMPIENGPAVLEKLRANELTKDIPVIFLTGITERDKIKKALVLKPQGYLLKPVDHDKLLAAIENTLKNGSAELS